MRKIKKISAVLAAAVLSCSAAMLGGCGDDEPSNTENNVDENGEVTYKVTVKDALGNLYTSGVIAQFYKGDEQIAMQVCDANGVATKKLKADDYTVALAFTDGDENFYYEKEGLSVSSSNNEIEIIVANAINSEGQSLYASSKEYDAYSVGTGCTYVELTAEDRNYFLFTPTEAGKYEFSIVEGSNVEIGYYGAPHYVQALSAAEVKDNKFSISIKSGMIGTGDTGTTVVVIGVDSKDASTTNCVIGVQRIGEPDYGVEDEPWTIYKKTVELSKYTLPAGVKLEEFDLTAADDAYNLVYNEADGFYHFGSADGPLVLVRLAEDSKYLASFKTILDNSGVVKYFYDENGEFVKKESYSECLLEYIEYVDEENGVYPLTEDLKYIIQQRGDYFGWWDADGANYLFLDTSGNKIPGINNNIAWLFMCCYISEN